MGDVYSLVMIDMPLIYEDTAILGDVETIQCCVPCCAEEGRRLCQAQALENWGAPLGALAPTSISPNSLSTTVFIPSPERKCQEEEGRRRNSSSLAPVLPLEQMFTTLLFVSSCALDYLWCPGEFPAWS